MNGASSFFFIFHSILFKKTPQIKKNKKKTIKETGAGAEKKRGEG